MNTRFTLAVAVTLAVVATAWKISTSNAPQTEVTRALLYPQLLDGANAVERLEARSAKATATLHRRDGTWTVDNLGGYPANAGTVKRVLLQLARLETVEAKTSKPESYPRIGVADVGPDSDATQVDVYGAGDAKMVALIVGHPRESGRDAQRYVRRAGETQSWLVDGKLDVSADPLTWVDTRVADIDGTRVRRVEVAPASGPVVVVSRADQAATDFTLEHVPAGLAVKSAATLAGYAAVLADLRFAGALAASDLGAATPLRRTTVETFDGLVARVDEYALEGRNYARLAFSVDAARAQAAVAAKVEPAKTTAPTDGPTPPPIGDGQATQDGTGAKKETVEEEVARLNAATSTWAYVLPEHKRRLLERGLNDLLQPATAQKDKKDQKERGAASAAGASGP